MIKNSQDQLSGSEPLPYYAKRNFLLDLAGQISFSARKKMFQVFMDTFSPDAGTRILDVGVSPSELLESNFFEALYPHKEMLTATSIEDASIVEKNYPGVKFIRCDGRQLPFADQSFDIAVSFAVVEHVGSREEQRLFISELLRVAKYVFVTTPNRWYPLEFHTMVPFIHWLPQAKHQALLRLLGSHFYAKTENLNLLDEKDLKQLFPQEAAVNLTCYKLLGIPSNFLAYTANRAK
ncbi:class I SAM-dependent methyltransferase [bacterium]|nr:class I SAM-dependent methyltransferase [bacterium]MBP9809075.1 class I SAM-dependent methyltransferase [bacterium]